MCESDITNLLEDYLINEVKGCDKKEKAIDFC